jgi:signal transduction histidine kinase
MTTIDVQPDPAAPVPARFAALAAWFGPGTPHIPRGPFARWPRIADGALVVAVFAASLIAVTLSELDDGERFTTGAIGDLPVGAIILLALASAALWFRRSRPVEVTMFVIVAMIVWALAHDGDGNDLPLMVATYSVGRYTTDHRLGLTVLVAAIAASMVGSIVDTSQRIDVLPALFLPALPWYVGRRVRIRGDYVALLRERAEHLEAEQHARARQAVAEERARIARELHDVVAHQVSMMTVQAGAAKTIARDDPETAIEAMGDVERAGREALGELRNLLGVLRLETGADDDLGPQRGLADLPALAEQLRHTGADVNLSIAELPCGATSALGLSVYRIVQESLTNVVKHAGTNPSVDVTVAADGHTLDIEVVNTVGNDTISTTDGADTRVMSALPTSGFGVAGMRERATLLGGTLTSGPQPPDRYRVHARLPLDPESP